MKKHLVYMILFCLIVPVFPIEAKTELEPTLIGYEISNSPFTQHVNITETQDSLTVDNGLSYTVELFKGSAGYDVIQGINGIVLVHSQRYTIETLEKAKWKQVGTPKGLSWVQDSPTEITVTRYYTDYLGTTIDVVYHFRSGEGVKVDVVVNSGETRDYRIVWELDGITQTQVNEYDKSVKFGDLETDTWIGFDWIDAYNQFGDIYTRTVSSTAQGRKLDIVFNLGLIDEGETLTLDPTIIDSYSEANQDGTLSMQATHPTAGAGYSANGQSFTADFKLVVTSAKFYLKKSGAPTGNAHAVIYAHSGVYGTSSVPTGAALATSDDFDVSTLTTSFALVTFTFSGAEQIELAAGTQYCLAFENPGSGNIDAGDYTIIGVDASSPSHDGNRFYYTASAWGSQNTRDVIFYLYGDAYIENEALDSDAAFSRNVEGWSNATVVDTAGVADLKTVDIRVNQTDGKSFELRWTQTSNTFSELTDADGICTLNATRSVRTNVNATSDTISFCFAITGGTDGNCNVTLTTTSDNDITDVDDYIDEFSYSTFGWTSVGDMLNSAFDYFFGAAFNFMGQVQTYITGLMAYFVDAMTDILLLVIQMFRVVNNTFTFCIDWLTRIITLFIAIFDIIGGIWDGTGDVTSGLGDLSVLFNVSDWIDFIPIVLLVSWMISLDARSPTQGFINALFGDINTVFNLTSFFLTWFSFVLDTVINLVMMLIDTIPGL